MSGLTFFRTADGRRGGGPGGGPVVHRYLRQTFAPTGRYYVALCGARAANISGLAEREVTCPRCLAKEQAP